VASTVLVTARVPGVIIEYHLKVKDGTPLISEIRVAAVAPENYIAERRIPDDAPVIGDGITARVLRKVPVGPEVIARALETSPIQKAIGAGPSTFQAAARNEPRRPGSHGRPDLYYARLAQLYVELVNAGSRSPVQNIADRLSADGQPYSRDYVRDQLVDARRRGLLTHPPRGRPGGQLTRRAVKLLDLPPPDDQR
jgi:hypothetical protein